MAYVSQTFITRFFFMIAPRVHASGFLPGNILRCLLIFPFAVLFTSCEEKAKVDPCCQYAALTTETDVKDGQGAVQVEGSTSAYFYVLDEGGEQIGYQSLNRSLALEPGHYKVKLNNSVHQVEVREGQLALCSTGTLMISGSTNEYYTVMDSANIQLGYETLGKPMSFFPGKVRVNVNNTSVLADVKLRELTEIRTGSLRVKGSTNEYYYVLDQGNKQLNYNTLEKPLAFLPGEYTVKVNNSSMQAHVMAGNLTELATGSLMVKGLTDEYYYVTDAEGNALNYQTLNRALSFFPGTFQIKVNNTVVDGQVTAGQTTELMTGSLILTGGATGYYYVLDQLGNQLNYNSLNKSLSFFPSEYTVKLGASSRKATVMAGQLTSISEFN